MDEEEEKRYRKIAIKPDKSDNESFLVSQLTQTLLKLQRADVMAFTVDELVRRNALGSRSLISDARLNYGNPHEYEYLDEDKVKELKQRYSD